MIVQHTGKECKTKFSIGVEFKFSFNEGCILLLFLVTMLHSYARLKMYKLAKQKIGGTECIRHVSLI